MSCTSPEGEYVDPVCPAEGGGPQGGGAHFGDRTWSTEATSYVSVGIFNLYLSTQITSSGIMLGVFLGALITGGMWGWAEKRKKKKKVKEVKDQEKEKEKTTALEHGLRNVLIHGSGSHSSNWPAFQGGVPHQPLQPPSAPTPQPNQLVPVKWCQ